MFGAGRVAGYKRVSTRAKAARGSETRIRDQGPASLKDGGTRRQPARDEAAAAGAFKPETKDRSLSPAASSEIREATEAVNWADAFVLASPDYHGSMSGALKNFLDHYWAEFAGKLFGYICASHEKGLTVMEQMRTAVRQCYGWSLPYGVAFNGDQDFDAEGNITRPLVAERLQMLARDLVAYGAIIREQFVSDIGGTATDTFAARYRK